MKKRKSWFPFTVALWVMMVYFAIFGPVWPLYILVPVLFVERLIAQAMLIMVGKALISLTQVVKAAQPGDKNG